MSGLVALEAPWIDHLPCSREIQVTREEAEAMSAQLAAEHPDRETHQWRPRQDGSGSWDVVKIALPAVDMATLQAETRADERPPTPDDVRTSSGRNLGPGGGAGF
jgi:hypothetical protein